MILTYKVKHQTDLTVELEKARQVAQYALKTKSKSSKDVKHFGLKSAISNQILKKYSSNKKLKSIKRVKLTVPNQGVKFQDSTIKIPCLRLSLVFDKQITKVNQIEFDDTYAFISCTVPERAPIIPTSFIGIDLNATSHCLVASNSSSGKVWKLGRGANHIHKKYKFIRKDLQKRGKFRVVKRIKDKESRCVRDLNHKISNKIVMEARNQNAGLVLEDLTGVRRTKKQAQSFKYSLHSWSFYQLMLFISYKAKLHGVPVFKIDPRYTSQQCSICGLLGIRTKKQFKCPHCGHVDHADVNASFVIGLRHQGVLQSIIDRDVIEGDLAPPKRLRCGDTSLRTPRL